ncbi:hypothetical protein [Qiania dongpingensis]|uniref:Uncharacterized protein n=1 Tax=Qiania dongpingensis TaxID=2763669 RepID=A0A7G9G0X6_9FIRM|nr:hypothetical protein [Qiania dongpingensis]QNM04458.1 hypothetical protein H9Q78_08135 [Qiania dongpingensis]
MEKENKLGLLESLAANMNCMYISDLNKMIYTQTQKLIHLLESYESNTYSAEVWRDAFIYLTGKDCPLSSPEEIRHLLIQRLEACSL